VRNAPRVAYMTEIGSLIKTVRLLSCDRKSAISN
jgi:hypothetical protein